MTAAASLSPSSLTFSPNDQLYEVYLYFSKRLEDLNPPRSIAEAGFTNTEVDALGTWFAEQWEISVWCEDRLRLEKAQGANQQEMVGALFLILATSAARDQGSDDSIWPAVAATFSGCKCFGDLFIAGHPTAECKKAVVAGVRRLRLRNLIDRIGKQEYFDTVKLQFGFTLRGAQKRLPEWLSGLGPMSARILSGQDPSYSDLKSDSFIKLWQTLKRYRERLVAEEYARHVLSNSPWIRPDWTDLLLEAARKATVPRAANHAPVLDEVEASTNESTPTVEPLLEWPEDSKPRLILRLAEENVIGHLTGHSSAEFVIDSKIVDRWTHLGGDVWRGPRALICPEVKGRINLRPQVMLIRSESRLVYESGPDELGISGPMTLFDLTSGRTVNPRSSLSKNRDYALICDSDLSVQGANKSLALSNGRAYRISGGLLESLAATCEGATYWVPNIAERKPFEAFDIALEFENGLIAPIDSVAPVLLRGVPVDAVAVKLAVGNSTYHTLKQEDSWKSDGGVKIGLKLALGEERVRVFVTGVNYARSLSPRLKLRLRGIAQRQASEGGDPEWVLVKHDRPLDRADGIGQARLFAGGLGEPLYEGYSEIRKVSSGALDLSLLQGWGARLTSGPLVLAQSVMDGGQIKFLPNLFRRETGQRLIWRTPTFPQGEHQILIWHDLSKPPQQVAIGKVRVDEQGLVWTLPPESGTVLAIAVAFKGLRLGSWLSADLPPLLARLRSTPQLFALICWLRIPVLNTMYGPLIMNLVARDQASFVGGWLGTGPPPIRSSIETPKTAWRPLPGNSSGYTLKATRTPCDALSIRYRPLKQRICLSPTDSSRVLSDLAKIIPQWHSTSHAQRGARIKKLLFSPLRRGFHHRAAAILLRRTVSHGTVGDSWTLSPPSWRQL